MLFQNKLIIHSVEYYHTYYFLHITGLVLEGIEPPPPPLCTEHLSHIHHLQPSATFHREAYILTGTYTWLAGCHTQAGCREGGGGGRTQTGYEIY